MKKKPPVSVLMPAYNAEKYIGEAIESILKQTFKNFEFIILDDASADNTLKIIQKYAKKDRRIITLKSKKNLYIAKARNKLLKKACGKYIVWQDADDISMVYRIKEQYDFMEKHPEVGICGGYLQFIDENGKKTSLRKYDSDNCLLRKKIFRQNPVAQPASMFRKSVIKKVGLYKSKYSVSEDLDMLFRIGIKYKFSNLQEIVIKYREYSNSSTFKHLKRMLINTIIIRKKYIKYYKHTFFDFIYNICQFILIISPQKIVINTFNKIRNTSPDI